MSRAEDYQAEDQVAAPQSPEAEALAAADAAGEGVKGSDAGAERGPTTVHEDAGWRAIDLAKP